MFNPNYESHIHNIIEPALPQVSKVTGFTPIELLEFPCDANWGSSNANNWEFAVYLPDGDVAVFYMDDSDNDNGFDVGKVAVYGIYDASDAVMWGFFHPSVTKN